MISAVEATALELGMLLLGFAVYMRWIRLADRSDVGATG
jgi:hypothetical protein